MPELKDEIREVMIDPSFNVSARFALEAKRQDDLRMAHEKLGDEQTRHLKEVADIRETHAKEIRAGDMKTVPKALSSFML